MPSEQAKKEYANKVFWGAVSYGFKGYAAGTVIGAVMGAFVGAGAHLIMAAANVMPWASLGATTAFFAAIGMAMGADSFMNTGKMTGAITTALLEKDALDGKSPALDTGKAAPEKPKRWYHKILNPKPAAIGALIGAIGGIALAASNFLSPENPIFLGYKGWQATVAAAAVMSLWGAPFGFAMEPFMAMKKLSDGWFEGKLIGGITEPVKAPEPVQEKREVAQEKQEPVELALEKGDGRLKAYQRIITDKENGRSETTTVVVSLH